MIALPVLLPLLTGILNLLAWRSLRTQRACSLAGATLQAAGAVWLLVSVQQKGIQHLAVGSWPAPFGIVLVADLFSAIMVTVAAVVALATVVYSQGAIDTRRAQYGYYPLFFFLLMGVNGAFITGDLFNLYVWFEVMLICALGLIALGHRRDQLDAAFKYLGLNLFGTLVLLAAVGMLYAATGQLNYDALSAASRGVDPALMRPLLAALVVALTVCDLYLDYRRQAATVVNLEEQILNVARATLTDLRDVRRPTVELQEEIDARRHELDTLNDIVPVSSSTSIDIFRAVSAAIPNGIRIDADDYMMDADAIRVRGNTDSFESVESIKQDMLGTGFFSDVQVKDARADPKGSGVDFRHRPAAMVVGERGQRAEGLQLGQRHKPAAHRRAARGRWHRPRRGSAPPR